MQLNRNFAFNWGVSFMKELIDKGWKNFQWLEMVLEKQVDQLERSISYQKLYIH